MKHMQDYLTQVSDTVRQLPLLRIQQVVDILEYARDRGQQVFLLGNGGSAATASHFACDLGKGANTPDRPRFRAIALADNLPMLSAWANDTAYDQVFAEQLANFLNPGDVVIAISCSGTSPNVVNALRLARGRGAVTVGLTGATGGDMLPLLDACICVPGACTEQVEDAHLVLEHVISRAIRRRAQPSGAAADMATGAGRDTGAAVFVDRDGVINENRAEYVRRWEDFSFLPGVFEALSDLGRDGHKVIVVSNQSAVGRGLIGAGDVDVIHARMLQEVERRGGHIDAVFYCPHAPDDGCDCRKPRPGLFLQAADRFGLDLKRSYVVGDMVSDILAAQAIGARPVLVLTGLGSRERSKLPAGVAGGHQVVQDLQAAVRVVFNGQ